MKMMRLTALDLLFPRNSLLGDEGALVTEREEKILAASAPVITERPQLREARVEFLDRIVAAADYERVPLLRGAIHAFKYRRVRGVGEALGRMIVRASVLFPSPPNPLSRESLALLGARERGDLPVLCPVPLHWTRKFSRGFNQAALLAEAVSRGRGWTVLDLLRRTRPTGHQTRKSREERFAGVRDAFDVRLRIELPRYVILVDDLATTGATMDMCAKVLKREGVERVEGLVVAMG